MSELTWEEVDSSNITRIAFDEEEERIIIEFKDGGQYAYDECPRELFERFRLAPSIGKFFYANIKNSHTFERLN